MKTEIERSLDGAKEAVADVGEPAPGEQADYGIVENSVCAKVGDIPESIDVPRLGKSLYGTNLGGCFGENYLESICSYLGISSACCFPIVGIRQPVGRSSASTSSSAVEPACYSPREPSRLGVIMILPLYLGGAILQGWVNECLGSPVFVRPGCG